MLVWHPESAPGSRLNQPRDTKNHLRSIMDRSRIAWHRQTGRTLVSSRHAHPEEEENDGRSIAGRQSDRSQSGRDTGRRLQLMCPLQLIAVHVTGPCSSTSSSCPALLRRAGDRRPLQVPRIGVGRRLICAGLLVINMKHIQKHAPSLWLRANAGGAHKARARQGQTDLTTTSRAASKRINVGCHTL